MDFKPHYLSDLLTIQNMTRILMYVWYPAGYEDLTNEYKTNPFLLE